MSWYVYCRFLLVDLSFIEYGLWGHLLLNMNFNVVDINKRTKEPSEPQDTHWCEIYKNKKRNNKYDYREKEKQNKNEHSSVIFNQAVGSLITKFNEIYSRDVIFDDEDVQEDIFVSKDIRRGREYTREERISYYSMLKRMKQMKKERKKLRQALRKSNQTQVEASSYIRSTAKGDFYFINSDSESEDEQAFDLMDDDEVKDKGLLKIILDMIMKIFNFKSLKQVSKYMYEKILECLTFTGDLFYSFFDGKTFSDYISDIFDNDIIWYGYLILTSLCLLRSRSIIEDVVIIGQFLFVSYMSNRSNLAMLYVVPWLISKAAYSKGFGKVRVEASGIPDDITKQEHFLADDIFTARNACADFITSHFCLCVSNIVLILASYHFFDKHTARQLQLWLGKAERPKSIPEAISKMVTNLGNLLKMGESVMRGNPISDVFLSGDPVGQATRNGNRLMREYPRLYFALPIKNGVDAKTWVKETETFLDVVKQFTKTTSPYDMRIPPLNEAAVHLTTKLMEVQSKSYRNKRATPYLVIVNGPPGIGKSSVTTWVYQVWSHIKGRVFEQNQVFEKNPDTDYYDGYEPHGTPIIHISEIGAKTKKLAEMGMEKGVAELTSIVDSLPYCLNMSKTEDKGRFYCIPELVVADTNREDLNLEAIVRNPAAYRRRGVYLTPYVKPEFQKKNGSCSLDPSIDAEDQMNKWTFDLKRYEAKSNTETNEIKLLDGNDEDSDIVALFKVLSEDMIKHIQREEKVLKLSTEDWVRAHAHRLGVDDSNAINPVGDDADDVVELLNTVKDNELDLSIDEEKYHNLLQECLREEKDESERILSCEWATSNFLCTVTTKANWLSEYKEIPGGFCQDALGNEMSIAYLKSRVNQTLPPIGVLRLISNKVWQDEKSRLYTLYEIRYFQLRTRWDVVFHNARDHIRFLPGLPLFNVRNDNYLNKPLVESGEWHSSSFPYTSEMEKRLNRPGPVLVSQGPLMPEAPIPQSNSSVYRFGKYVLQGTKYGAKFASNCLKVCLFGVLTLPSCVRGVTTEAYAGLLGIIVGSWVLAPLLLIPTLCVTLPSALLILLDTHMPNVIKGVPRYMFKCAWKETYNSFLSLSRYLQHKDNFKIVVSVASLVFIAKVVSVLYTNYSSRKQKTHSKTESDFLSEGKIYSDAKDVESKYDMSPPVVRIRSKEPSMTYSNIMIPPELPLSKSGSFDDFLARLRRNTRPIMGITTIKGETFNRRAVGMGVQGNVMLLPLHLFDFEKGDSWRLQLGPSMELLYNEEERGFVYSTTMIIQRDMIVEVSPDVGILKVNGTQFKDVLKFFPKTKIKVSNLKVKTNDITSYANDMPDLKSDDPFFKRCMRQSNIFMYRWNANRSSKCGSPIACEVSGGFYLLGIHCAGNEGTDVSFGTQLSQEMVSSALSKLTDNGFMIKSVTESGSLPVDEPLSRSFVRYIPLGPVTYHGMVHYFNGNQKTQIRRTVFSNDIDFKSTMEKIIPGSTVQDFAPAVMAPSKKGSPITNGALKLVSVRKPARPDLIRKAIDIVTNRIISNLDKIGVCRTQKPFDFESVLNGHLDDYLCRSIDMAKSGGFGYPGKKRDHMNIFQKGEVNHYETSERLMSDVLGIIREYENERSSSPVFGAAMKDEVRPMAKVAAMKTRIFYSSPLPFLIVQKAFMGPLYTLMIEHGKAFYTALGIDMTRTGQTIKSDLVDFAKSHKSKPNFIEGDYGGYDTSMPYLIGEAACEVSYRLLKYLGYNECQLKVVSGILTDLLFPNVDFFGDLITVPGLQPSGKYATAEDNSIRNLLIMVYVWLDKVGNDDFFDHVLPYVYGDDMLAAVLDAFKDKYNNVVLAEGCDDIGLEFTTSDKGKVVNPFISEDKISFLKRTFAHKHDLDRDVARLDKCSIYKTLSFIEISKAVNVEQQYSGLVRSALDESFFWTNRNEYNELKDYLLSVLQKEFEGATFVVSSYDELLERYSL